MNTQTATAPAADKQTARDAVLAALTDAASPGLTYQELLATMTHKRCRTALGQLTGNGTVLATATRPIRYCLAADNPVPAQVTATDADAFAAAVQAPSKESLAKALAEAVGPAMDKLAAKTAPEANKVLVDGNLVPAASKPATDLAEKRAKKAAAERERRARIKASATTAG